MTKYNIGHISIDLAPTLDEEVSVLWSNLQESFTSAASLEIYIIHMTTFRGIKLFTKHFII